MRKYLTGAVCLVVSVVVVLADSGHGWSWPLLVAGLALGTVGVVGSFAIGRRNGLDAADWDAYPSFVLLSVGIAILAAGLRSAWPDVVFAAYVVVANFLIPITVLRRLGRPQSHSCGSSAACDATACATCPLSTQVQAVKSA
ncbi:MAG: hypothetical protein ACTHK4_13880 [Mycobacteriales bacterium]